MGSLYASAYPSMDRDTPEARARAATMSYDESRAAYEDEVNRARMARDQAMGNADRTRGDAETSIADYAKGGPTPLTSWKPTAMTAYAPTQMAQWMSSASAGRAAPTSYAPTETDWSPTATRDYAPTWSSASGARAPLTPYAPPADDWSPTATRDFKPTWSSVDGGSGLPTRSSTPVGRTGPNAAATPTATFDSANLRGFDAAALENFDPSSYGKEFAGGAYGDFKRNLSDELRVLTNQSVGAGRFTTGLFDEDQGRVINRLGESFNDKIAQESGVFSGQRLSALEGGANLRYKRASEMDTNARSITELNATNAATAARQAADLASAEGIAYDQHAIERDRVGLEGYGLETDRSRVAGGFAQSADELAYKRASDMDRLSYDQAKGLTDVGENRARTARDTAIGRERTYLDESYRRSGDATSAASGQLDWAARNKEMEDLRAEIAAIRKSQGLDQYGAPAAVRGGT